MEVPGDTRVKCSYFLPFAEFVFENTRFKQTGILNFLQYYALNFRFYLNIWEFL